MTSETQTELFLQVVLPNGELRVLVDFVCQAVALANPNFFLETNSPKKTNPPHGGAYSKQIMRHLCRGGDEQIDVKIQFTGVVDGSVSLPRVAQYGVSPYLIPNLPWGIVFWGTHGVTNIV